MLLEDYFFNFPPTLLRFEDLVNAYQAEAMVWMHGLFTLICTSPM